MRDNARRLERNANPLIRPARRPTWRAILYHAIRGYLLRLKPGFPGKKSISRRIWMSSRKEGRLRVEDKKSPGGILISGYYLKLLGTFVQRMQLYGGNIRYCNEDSSTSCYAVLYFIRALSSVELYYVGLTFRSDFLSFLKKLVIYIVRQEVLSRASCEIALLISLIEITSKLE